MVYLDLATQGTAEERGVQLADLQVAVVAHGKALYALQLFAQPVADAQVVALAQTDEVATGTLGHQLQQLGGGEHGVVVDGYLALHLKPSTL